MIFVAFFCFALGVICGVMAQPSQCDCSDCQRQRWMEGDELSEAPDRLRWVAGEELRQGDIVYIDTNGLVFNIDSSAPKAKESQAKPWRPGLTGPC